LAPGKSLRCVIIINFAIDHTINIEQLVPIYTGYNEKFQLNIAPLWLILNSYIEFVCQLSVRLVSCADNSDIQTKIALLRT
jgi:hypothetical protein